MALEQPPLALLGIPIANASMDEMINEIENLIQEYSKDLRPRYVATLNVDFLVKVHPWFGFQSSNPELLHILRQASIVTIDGRPLMWLSRLLGTPVIERITGVDLVPRLCETLGEKKQAVFLLGGEEKTLKLCMLYLEAMYPGLRIAGTLAPHIHIQGEILENADKLDSLLIEQINKAGPDILLLNLGNPKQEIWFERIRPHLHVPITIGVGGTFDLITGMKQRAPEWMQKLGLEWFFRLAQEPKRLAGRYAADLFKFPWLATPLILIHTISRFIYGIRNPARLERTKLRSPLLFISANHTLVAVPLPKRLNELVCKELHQQEDDLFSQDALILDFLNVTHIDLEGIALIINMWKRAIKEKKNLYSLSISSDIKFLLQLHRVWDIVEPYACHSIEELMARLPKTNGHTTFYDSIQQNRNTAIVSIFGRLDNDRNYEAYLKKLGPIIFQKTCILDFSYCTYIDNTGFNFLLQLKKNQPRHFTSLKLCSLNEKVTEQFETAQLLQYFEIIPNLDHIIT